jgi:hypothetical protein
MLPRWTTPGLTESDMFNLVTIPTLPELNRYMTPKDGYAVLFSDVLRFEPELLSIKLSRSSKEFHALYDNFDGYALYTNFNIDKEANSSKGVFL